ncbi:MAG: hypothetical protein HYZ42_00015 [Bacteroidetes bacterium]|nr:hypothetical protein [Bacteroidota bacterium]
MKIKSLQNAHSRFGIFAFVIGAIASLVLLTFKYLNITNIELETAIAPLLVPVLLIYGDKILLYILTTPFSFLGKLRARKKDVSSTQQS